MKISFFAVLAVALLSSCVTYQLRAPGSTWLKDADRMVSVTKGSVTVSATARLVPELRFDVSILNKGGEPLPVGADAFQVFTGGANHWVAGAVASADDYLARQKSRVRTFEVTTTQVTRPVQTTTVISNGGRTTTYIVTQPEPETRTVTVNTGPSQTDLDRLQKSLWTATSVPAQGSAAGWVYADAPASSQYKLVVTLGGQAYELVFERVAKRVGPLTPADEWY